VEQHIRNMSVFAAKDSVGLRCKVISMAIMKINISVKNVGQDHLKKKRTIMTEVAHRVLLAPIIRQTI
jgi:hypothetical protein